MLLLLSYWKIIAKFFENFMTDALIISVLKMHLIVRIKIKKMQEIFKFLKHLINPQIKM